MDRREVTIEVADAKLASNATWSALEEFARCMREVLVEDGARFDRARHHLLHQFGVRITATRTVFDSNRT